MAQQRRSTRSIPQVGGRDRRPTGRGTAPPKKPNTGLIIGLGVGGFFLLVIIIAAIATSGGPRQAAAPRVEKEPVSVAELETAGLSQCNEGLGFIQGCDYNSSDKTRLRSELQRGLDLLTKGMAKLDKANQLTNFQSKYDTNKYGQAMKLARGKLLELK